jgi:uncharacterized SAM-binding protein YcdF (DUF218 family)
MKAGDLTAELIAEITEIVFGPPPGDPQPCEVIFVFGGSHPGLWERTAEAYHQGLGREVVVTGGHKPGAQRHPAWRDGDAPEAHVIRRELIRLGVPAGVIAFEDRSTNTLENVLYALEVYEFSRIGRVLAVCKSYGAGRQCRTLQQHLPAGVQVAPYPFDTTIGSSPGPVITRFNWMEWESSRLAMLSQCARIYRYGLKGHLRPVERFSAALLARIGGGGGEGLHPTDDHPTILKL